MPVGSVLFYGNPFHYAEHRLNEGGYSLLISPQLRVDSKAATILHVRSHCTRRIAANFYAVDRKGKNSCTSVVWSPFDPFCDGPVALSRLAAASILRQRAPFLIL